MPRNDRKNTYYTIGIPNASPILAEIRQQSQRSGASIPNLILQRLLRLYDAEHGNAEPVVAIEKHQQEIPVDLSVAEKALGEWE